MGPMFEHRPRSDRSLFIDVHVAQTRLKKVSNNLPFLFQWLDFVEVAT